MPRRVDPSEFSDQPANPGNGPRKVDPSEFQDAPPTSEGHPWLAAGVRGLASVLGAEGGWAGAGINALGESGAEMLEHGSLDPSNISPTRVGAEAAIGAVPFAKFFKAGAPVYSALRGGLMGASSEGIREYSKGQDLDPTAIAIQGGISALTGGALSKLFGGRVPKVEVPTAPTGGTPDISINPITGQKTFRVPATAKIPPGNFELPQLKPSQQTGAMGDVESGLKTLLKPAMGEGPDVQGLQKGIDTATSQGAQTRAKNFRTDTAATKAEQAADADWYKKQQAATQQATTAQNVTNRMADYDNMSPEDMQDVVDQLRKFRVAKAEEQLNQTIGQAAGPKAPPAAPTPPQATAPPPTPGPSTPVSAPVAAPQAPQSEGSPLSFFGGATPKVDAVGQAYRAAKGEEGLNPLALKQLGASLTSEASNAGLPVKTGTAFSDFLQSKISPEISGKVEAAEQAPTSEARAPSVGPESPAPSESVTTATPDWVKAQSDAVDAMSHLNEEMKRVINDQGGAMSTELLHQFLAPAAGAVVGAPIGAYEDEDDPVWGGMKGAMAGGTLGWYATAPSSKEAIDQLIQIRNAGLLMGPAQVKKHLSDFAAYMGTIAENKLGNNPGLAKNMTREMFNPVNFSNYLKAFKNPEIAQHIIGDTPTAAAERMQSMGMYEKAAIRPIAAAQYATEQALIRSGLSQEEARETLLLGDPKTKLGQWWVNAQSLPGASGQVIRAVRPFARIATNLAERGLERTPGLGMLFDNGENRLGKQLTGVGAMGLGALAGVEDSNQDEAGEPTPALLKGLRRAAMGSYGLPFTLGEATASNDWVDAVRSFPGAAQMLPPAKKGQFYPKTLASQYLQQILPSWLAPNTGSQGSR